jgi:hypothetical protein
MKKRFNKDNVLTHIQSQMEALEKKWGFDNNNGYAQVKNSEFERVMAYGEYMALDVLHDDLFYGNLES